MGAIQDAMQCLRETVRVRSKLARSFFASKINGSDDTKMPTFDDMVPVEQRTPHSWEASQKAIEYYGRACDNCGVDWELQCHHVKPRRCGGDHRLINLRVLCSVCHWCIENHRPPRSSKHWNRKNEERLQALRQQNLPLVEIIVQEWATLPDRLYADPKKLKQRSPKKRKAYISREVVRAVKDASIRNPWLPKFDGSELEELAFKELRFQQRQIENKKLLQMRKRNPLATFSLGDKLRIALV